jgi:hypothetical protein
MIRRPTILSSQMTVVPHKPLGGREGYENQDGRLGFEPEDRI